MEARPCTSSPQRVPSSRPPAQSPPPCLEPPLGKPFEASYGRSADEGEIGIQGSPGVLVQMEASNMGMHAKPTIARSLV